MKRLITALSLVFAVGAAAAGIQIASALDQVVSLPPAVIQALS